MRRAASSASSIASTVKSPTASAVKSPATSIAPPGRPLSRKSSREVVTREGAPKIVMGKAAAAKAVGARAEVTGAVALGAA
eukprot:scaffold130181_cov36-Phaeocystis_antarctica.AAC.1